MFVHWLLVLVIAVIQLLSNIARPFEDVDPTTTTKPAPLILDGATDEKFLTTLIQSLGQQLDIAQDANNKGDLDKLKNTAQFMLTFIPRLDQVVQAIALNAIRVQGDGARAAIMGTTNSVVAENGSMAFNIACLYYSWNLPDLVNAYISTLKVMIGDIGKEFADIRNQGAQDTTVQ